VSTARGGSLPSRHRRGAHVALAGLRVLWLLVHLVWLTGFKNRVRVLAHWTIAFLGRGRAERAITEQQVFGRQALAAPSRGGEVVD
jgi:hypothetical protein